MTATAVVFPRQEPPDEKSDRELLVYIVGWLHAFNDWHGHVDEALDNLKDRDEDLGNQVSRVGKDTARSALVTRAITIAATVCAPIVLMVFRDAVAHFLGIAL